jgi:type II secretory pathway pseudopilin PulG
MNLANLRKAPSLIELLVVMAIVGTLSSVVLFAISDSRLKGRDAGRKAQVQEILKALEIFYTDGSGYPDDGTPADSATGDTIASIGSGFIAGTYLRTLPEEPERYFYCLSNDRKSLLLALNTEEDRGGSNFCQITRGPGPDYGCTAWIATNAADSCLSRF